MDLALTMTNILRRVNCVRLAGTHLTLTKQLVWNVGQEILHYRKGAVRWKTVLVRNLFLIWSFCFIIFYIYSGLKVAYDKKAENSNWYYIHRSKKISRITQSNIHCQSQRKKYFLGITSVRQDVCMYVSIYLSIYLCMYVC